MKRSTWMWLIIAAVPTVCLAQDFTDTYVSGSLDAEFQSLYMFRGFRFYGNKSAMQITADVKAADTGFGFALQPHFANGGGYVNDQRWDWNPYFANSVASDEMFALDYRVNYVYYNYARKSSKVADKQEINAIVSMPNIIGVEGLAPRYQIIKMWQSKGGDRSVVRAANGWMHVLGLDYDLELPGLTPEMPSLPVGFMAEIVYNDGLNPIPGTNGRPANSKVDSDWSHFVLGADCEFDMGYDISLKPSIYYQRTMEPDLRAYSKENEVWFTLSGKWTF
ncbi:MAG: hypothetical protein MI922_13485 [Bacteroidales bacterium]|nr:hypothetical protein [Bacteroidales bacterium]